eukprot:8242244-Alexandrium_andersonii.AAC.1
MSASLVGSEMCIRDSHPPAATEATAAPAAAGQPAQPRAPEQPRPPQPVSYTHLTLPTICSV